MGAVLSFLRDAYHSLSLLIGGIAEESANFKTLEARISSPQLPVQNPTASFWQQKPPYPKLVNIKSAELPALADIVIIGSGISGASIAYTILNECRSMGIARNVTILEGRTICSGATGRNGGHIKVAPYLEYAAFKKRFGPKSAKKIMEFQMMHRPTLLELTKAEELEVAETREVMTVDAFVDSSMWQKAQGTLAMLKADLPNVASGVEILSAEKLQEQYGFNENFVGGLTYLSGAMWPYRLVTSLFNSLLTKFSNEFSIETETMVEQIQTTNDPKRPFLLKTSRGEISAAHVIHATDASAANLVPGLKGKVFPVRGTMSAQRPGKAFPDYKGKVSWSIINKNDFEYISQRPGLPDADDGLGAEIMTGGGSGRSDGNGYDEVGQWADNKVLNPVGSYLAGVLSQSFKPSFWGEDADGSKVKMLWTGCMGFTPDMMPYVGQLSPHLTNRKVKRSCDSDKSGHDTPEPSEWISAGFHGQGMALAWLSGVAIGLMVLGREKKASEGLTGRPKGIVSEWFPEEFICSPERVSRSSIYELPKLL